MIACSAWVEFHEITRDYTRESEARPDAPKIDIYDSSFPAHIWLMIMYGILDSTWQSYAYWLMGAMSNDMSKLAVFTGFCKSLLDSCTSVLNSFHPFRRQMPSVIRCGWCMACGRGRDSVSFFCHWCSLVPICTGYGLVTNWPISNIQVYEHLPLNMGIDSRWDGLCLTDGILSRQRLYG